MEITGGNGGDEEYLAYTRQYFRLVNVNFPLLY